MSHSVWIQVLNKGKVDQPATVHLYFGEIRKNLIEKGINYYEGEIFKDFVAFVKPHNSTDKNKLTLLSSEESVSAVFTPKKPGIYQLVAYNESSSVKDYTKYGLGLLKDSIYLRTTFEATARKKKQEGKIDLSPMMKYDIVPFLAKNGYGDYNSHQSTWRVNEKIYARFYINGEVAVEKEIKVYSPDGWTTVVKTNKNGEFNFKPYKKGIYQAIYQTNKKLKGIHKGKKYTHTRVKVITNINIE